MIFIQKIYMINKKAKEIIYKRPVSQIYTQSHKCEWTSIKCVSYIYYKASFIFVKIFSENKLAKYETFMQSFFTSKFVFYWFIYFWCYIIVLENSIFF